MLIAEPTKYRAGLTLYGDYNDLISLRAAVSKLSEQIPLAGHFEEFVLGLAYELRKAYEGRREEKEFGFDSLDKVSYYGCKLLWPIFLVQLGLLRWAAAFNPTTKSIQANLFQLEAATEQALIKSDAKIGAECIEWLADFRGFPTNYLLQFVEDVCMDYISIPRSGKQRFSTLPRTLRSTYYFSNEYQTFKERLDHISKFQKCRPNDLMSTAEWPDFKW